MATTEEKKHLTVVLGITGNAELALRIEEQVKNRTREFQLKVYGIYYCLTNC